MKSRERVLCALAGERPDRVPFCESSIAPSVVRALQGGEDDLSEAEISDLLGRDIVVATLFPPYFADYETSSDGQEYVTTGWIKTRADLDKMIFPDPSDDQMYETAQQVLDNRGDYAATAAIKLGVAPMFISMGLDGFADALYEDPGLIHEVASRYVDWQLEVTERLVDMGFDLIWSFDDVAFKTSTFCSPSVFREFLLPVFRRASAAITVPWIFHSDGNIMSIVDDLLSLGMQGIHPIEPEAMNLATVKARYGDRVCLVGNVSVDALSAGEPERVRSLVKECIRVAAPGGGYMISSSNSIPSYAQPSNVWAMANAIKEYGQYPLRL